MRGVEALQPAERGELPGQRVELGGQVADRLLEAGVVGVALQPQLRCDVGEHRPGVPDSGLGPDQVTALRLRADLLHVADERFQTGLDGRSRLLAHLRVVVGGLRPSRCRHRKRR
jgi:hypothetical protein